jgi:2'-5' RNA ligase
MSPDWHVDLSFVGDVAEDNADILSRCRMSLELLG